MPDVTKYIHLTLDPSVTNPQKRRIRDVIEKLGKTRAVIADDDPDKPNPSRLTLNEVAKLSHQWTVIAPLTADNTEAVIQMTLDQALWQSLTKQDLADAVPGLALSDFTIDVITRQEARQLVAVHETPEPDPPGGTPEPEVIAPERIVPKIYDGYQQYLDDLNKVG